LDRIYLTMYRRVLFYGTIWSLIVAAAGLLEAIGNTVALALFGAGAVFEYIAPLARRQTMDLSNLEDVPKGARSEPAPRTMLRAFLDLRIASLALGLLGGAFLPPVGGFAGGCAVGLAFATYQHATAVIREERERGWRVVAATERRHISGVPRVATWWRMTTSGRS
jgi:hypothetical protein